MSFKEVFSVHGDVEHFLNQDSQLDRNSKLDQHRPDISKVKKEAIIKHRSGGNMVATTSDVNTYCAFSSLTTYVNRIFMFMTPSILTHPNHYKETGLTSCLLWKDLGSTI